MAEYVSESIRSAMQDLAQRADKAEAERDALAAKVRALAITLDGFAEASISVPDSELFSTLSAEIRKAVEIDHG